MIKINKNVVPDTSVLINKKLFEYIQSGKLKNINLIIPRFVIDELQAQAAVGRDVGFQGLEEIKRLRKLCKERNINLKFSGRRPTLEEISLAKKGRIDALIRDFAIKEKAVLITSDYVQALVGEAEGADILYIPSEVIKRKITIENFFTDDTQSVHLKPGLPPYAKIGKPGSVRYVKIRENPLEESELKAIINEIYAKIHRDPDSFIEINKQGATVIQMGNYRISITRPPFSDAIELTAVRPIVKLSLEDYNLPKDIEKRIVDKSSGILIAGPPGSGKSSFASALAEFLASKNKVIKTFEQPRDLQVGPHITQYAPLEGDWESAAE
jgi:ATPase